MTASTEAKEQTAGILGLRLHDIFESITMSSNEVADTTFDTFERDRRKQLIVERRIEIISEASRIRLI
jgi:uncharacterized protein with HEPN domain